MESRRRSARIAIVGIGGLGAPAALALAHAGVGTLVLLDDDEVDRTNLHRQILYRDADVGRPKLEAAADSIARENPETSVVLARTRLTPGSLDVLRGVDVVLECSDNFATKFLAADAARLAGIPIVHGASVRWVGTAFAVSKAGAPCYRCLFEDIPEGAQAGCDVAGVVGPVCGVIGGMQAELSLRIVDGLSPFGTIVCFDGLRDTLRTHVIARRRGCALCGEQPTITTIDPGRYGA